ncbi:MAG: hypothetical protein OSJ43_04275 [Oscillospiraceae bacterium]|nr:hypothetical protein [Oscillospiraceae bacterium]
MISICTAALLLAGCGGGVPDMPSFVFPDSGSGSSRYSSSTQSVSKPDNTTASTETKSDTYEPASVVETSEPISAPSEVSSLTLSHDPINEKTVELRGNTVIISGKTADSPINYMSVFPRGAEFDLNSDKDGFSAEIVLTEPQSGYLTVTLVYEDGHNDEIMLEVTQHGFELWDLSDIAENNRKAVENAIEQPQNQVAEYIVKGGKPDEIRKVLEEIQALSDEICAGLNSDYDKLRAISRWVSANIYYDYPAYDKGVPAETLSLKYMLDKHSSVCGGYSNMTSALCAAQGIKCWNVHGAALNGGRMFVTDNDSEYHEWNFAEIDGRVIWVDSGWNSYCYLRRDGVYENGGICYRYFDIGEEYFALNHKASYAEYRDYFAILR